MLVDIMQMACPVEDEVSQSTALEVYILVRTGLCLFATRNPTWDKALVQTHKVKALPSKFKTLLLLILAHSIP